MAERHIPKCATIINKPGGIKPSRIQEKYVVGTGTGKVVSTSYVQPKSINSKPNFATKTEKVKVENYSYGNKVVSKPVREEAPSYQVGGSSLKPSVKGNSRNNANKYW